jgi:hypothetical protein
LALASAMVTPAKGSMFALSLTVWWASVSVIVSGGTQKTSVPPLLSLATETVSPAMLPLTLL